MRPASVPLVTGLFPRPIIRSPADHAVEHHDLAALRDALDAGADVEEAQFGMSLLHHSVDVEGDGSAQCGIPLHVDMTAFLLARGADPTRRSSVSGMTPEELARKNGNWLATELFEAWRRERDR